MSDTTGSGQRSSGATVIVEPDRLRRLVAAIFEAAGTHATNAARVAESLVESNLVGHDSHGVIRVHAYTNAIAAGTLHPNGEIRAVRERATTALLDCGWTFGQVAAAHGMRLAIEKAVQHDSGIVVLRHCDHTGRLGEYAVMAAQQGLVGLAFCNGSSPGGIVAPFGGTGRALGANPLAWAIPAGADADRPLFLDFATSAVAQGKLQVAVDKGEQIPEGWILNREGQPTRNPRDQFDGGVLLPFGGHKGYALSVMIELLGGGLSGSGFPLLPGYRWDQGTMLVAINVEAFQSLAEFRHMAAEFSTRLKATPRAAGVDEILLPGELEWRCKAAREAGGIPLPAVTWERLAETARALHVPVS